MYLVKFKIILLLNIYIINALKHGIDIKCLLEGVNNETIVNRTIEQPLDHFDRTENRTFKMRYFERLDLWKAGGPIYLYIGGEGAADTCDLVLGLMPALASETKGAMYLSEHRYYGLSQPFPEINTASLAYLSSRQALADLAKLLQHIKSSPQYNDSKIIVTGGSYAGNLAAWMRLLYPDLVDAAIASSAPVLAMKDFYEYLEVVGESFKQYGTKDCYSKIEEIFSRYNQFLQTSAGIEQLKNEENICEKTDMTKQINQNIFFYDKVTKFSGLAQYAMPKEIETYCKNMLNGSNLSNDTKSFNGPPETSILKYLTLQEFDFRIDEPDCYNYDFDKMIKGIKLIPWYYQTCTEFGYFQSTTSDKQPFTKNIPVEMFYRICIELFGPQFNEKRIDDGIKYSNDMYGGLSPNVTKVVFVNGDKDPWHKLGITQDLSSDAPAILINGTPHCADLQSDGPDDPEQLTQAREYIKSLIKKWIGIDQS